MARRDLARSEASRWRHRACALASVITFFRGPQTKSEKLSIMHNWNREDWGLRLDKSRWQKHMRKCMEMISKLKIENDVENLKMIENEKWSPNKIRVENLKTRKMYGLKTLTFELWAWRLAFELEDLPSSSEKTRKRISFNFPRSGPLSLGGRAILRNFNACLKCIESKHITPYYIRREFQLVYRLAVGYS